METHVEGCENLWSVRDGNVLDPIIDNGEVEGNHMRGVRIIDRAIKAVSPNPKAEWVGDTRAKVC